MSFFFLFMSFWINFQNMSLICPVLFHKQSSNKTEGKLYEGCLDHALSNLIKFIPMYDMRSNIGLF